MRKWTYLVAALLLTGTTATFTGCIDTDEPAGITDLRGAKAELIKAQAAVKLVEVEMAKAQVANQLLLNAGVELKNKSAEIDLEIHKLDVELKKLEVERDQANTAEKKAAAEAAIAKANLDKATYENAKAIAAEEFKKALFDAQTATAWAQETYDKAIKAIEAAKLLMTQQEKDIVVRAQQEMEAAAGQMNTKLDIMQTAQEALNKALTNFDVANLAADLANKLAKKELNLANRKLEVARLQKMLETPISSDVTAWENEVAQMRVDKLAAKEKAANAAIEILKIEKSAPYKAAEKLVTDKTDASNKAKIAYTKANTATPQKIAKYEDKSVANNATVVNGLKEAQSKVTGLTGYNENGTFSYAEATYTEIKYVGDKDNAVDPTNAATTTLTTVENWIKLVDTATEGINLEDIAWSNRELNTAKTEAATALTAFTTAKTAWETARDAFETNAIPDLAKAKVTVEAAIATWNGLTEAKQKEAGSISTLAKALKTYYEAADANIKKTNKTVTSAGSPVLTKEISAWMLEDESYFANVVAPELRIITYASGQPTIATTSDIEDPNVGYLVNLVDGTGQSLLVKFRIASTTAFGTLVDLTTTKPRLTEVTEAEVRADAKKNNLAINATNYGALGAKIQTADEVARMTKVIEQADAYKALRTVIVGQQTALKAEIAANTAIVAKALVAKDTAENEMKAAEAAKKALTAEQIDIKEANITLARDLEKIITAIETRLKRFLDGSLTAAEFMASINEELLEAQKLVVTAEGKVAKAKKNIELYNKGEYTEAYAITNAQEDLAMATKDYEYAKVIYDKAVAQVKIVIDTLVK